MVEKKWTGGRSTLIVREMAPKVLLLTMSGYHDDVDVPKQFATWFERRTATGELMHMFWDTTETTGYKTECREALQEWQKEAKARVASSMVLVRSRIMEMALSITNLIVGGLNKATRDRSRFETMLRSAVAASRGAWSSEVAAPPPA
jgi:hypothetical protein